MPLATCIAELKLVLDKLDAKGDELEAAIHVQWAIDILRDGEKMLLQRADSRS
jgi:hypothetical protein